jgi:hypothetical protein
MFREKDDKAKIKIKHDHVLVNGQKFKDTVQPPNPEEILYMNRDTRSAIKNIEFVTTRSVNIANSKFQLYAVSIYSPEQCRIAYKAISSIPQVASKTHLISAYHLSTDEMGWQDDGDYGLGRFLLRSMQEKQLDDTVCFLTREYGGVHIGQKRFSVIEQLLNMMIENSTAEPNKKGKYPFRISPPCIEKLSPSEQNDWEIPRKTFADNRQNPTNDGNMAPLIQTNSQGDIQPPDRSDGERSTGDDDNHHSDTGNRNIQEEQEEDQNSMDITSGEQTTSTIVIGKPIIAMTTAELKFKTLSIEEKDIGQIAEETINDMIAEEQRVARQNQAKQLKQFKQQQYNDKNTNQAQPWQPQGVITKEPTPKMQQTNTKIVKENEKQQTQDASNDTHTGKQDEKQGQKQAEQELNTNNNVIKEPVQI